jgi:hypothetical protein
MLRKLFVVAALVLAGAVLGGTVRSAEKKKTNAPRPRMGTVLVHTVIFHLKKDAPDKEAENLIADARKMLRRIPTVRHLWVGKPGDKGAGRFNKRFDVGLVVLFSNAAGLKTYIDSKEHKDFVKKHEKYLDRDKLSVFDFVNLGTPAAKTAE